MRLGLARSLDRLTYSFLPACVVSRPGPLYRTAPATLSPGDTRPPAVGGLRGMVSPVPRSDARPSGASSFSGTNTPTPHYTPCPTSNGSNTGGWSGRQQLPGGNTGSNTPGRQKHPGGNPGGGLQKASEATTPLPLPQTTPQPSEGRLWRCDGATALLRTHGSERVVRHHPTATPPHCGECRVLRGRSLTVGTQLPHLTPLVREVRVAPVTSPNNNTASGVGVVATGLWDVVVWRSQTRREED